VLTDDPETMSAHLDQLGADHRKYAVEPRHYDVAGRALVNAFKTVAGPRLTPEMIEALTASYERLASTMIDAAMRRRTEPATWGARVIGHTRVADDFAIVTVQADSPYFFKPGQYLTLELASRPKLWRQMSIASAPRPDNTFDLHVRAVNATGVSGALVRHTRLGDRMRLGPPRGNDLVVEPGTVSRGLLCVASGTGAAPISAVVESVLNWPEIPEHIYAYVGGRTRLDVYPVQRLNELIRNHGVGNRAHVEPVLSDDPEFAAHHGRVESVVPRLHDWASLGVDVLIAGPASMMSATIANLRMAGVPRSRIHFDQYDAAA
jgi:NAD(P)H-flavin reductase